MCRAKILRLCYHGGMDKGFINTHSTRLTKITKTFSTCGTQVSFLLLLFYVCERCVVCICVPIEFVLILLYSITYKELKQQNTQLPIACQVTRTRALGVISYLRTMLLAKVGTSFDILLIYCSSVNTWWRMDTYQWLVSPHNSFSFPGTRTDYN